MILEEVETREDLVVFIKQLELEVASRECNWGNTTLEDYLEAMSAWINDMGGLYSNLKIDIKNEPMWRTFARILRAATIYE
ncbi:hypothetical protein Daes_0623 [Pseudodesulfovibrio aespoeensis Aspo-2]|uniref:DUF7660 domain-containing protein n=2 Tax=Desulfovibrionaceae TaxID=194924 RepID=E6VYX8_PSEA9|nr:hypothetical protein Daes_0623 [Pseudodesulfovibrio aespoeensis Aspo-2]